MFEKLAEKLTKKNTEEIKFKSLTDSVTEDIEAKPEAMFTNVAAVEVQMKERLEKLGYKVALGLGNKNTRISLAVYDDYSDKYLIGIELDKDAFAASSSAMERDVYKPKFLEQRGWTIMRVWCRDWWLSPTKVIRSIVTAAEKNRVGVKPPKNIAKNIDTAEADNVNEEQGD